MKLAVVAGADSLDVRTWSGTPYFMTKALQTRYRDLVPVRVPRPPWFQYLRRITRKATAGWIDLYWNQYFARLNARDLANRLRREGVGAAVCIANSPLSAFLALDFPTIHVSDTTVPLMLNYYDEFSRLSKATADAALEFDRKSVLESAACLYPTAWAAKSAVNDYRADQARVHAIPWGANIERPTIDVDDDGYSQDHCHMVFIGVDWQRKGGPLAVETALRLGQMGLPVKLHIIGAEPNLPDNGDTIIIHGFLNKGLPEGRAVFDTVMRQATFFFLPTRQECYGIVFPEANSYGVPVISTQTGGVPDVIQEGVNGHLLPIGATAQDYAELIRTLWSNRSAYNRLRKSARMRFANALNWDSWLTGVAPVIDKVIAQPTRL